MRPESAGITRSTPAMARRAAAQTHECARGWHLDKGLHGCVQLLRQPAAGRHVLRSRCQPRSEGQRRTAAGEPAASRRATTSPSRDTISPRLIVSTGQPVTSQASYGV